MARILFLAPADLGEAVLATGPLGALIQPGDALSVVCASPLREFYRAAPGLEAMHVFDKGAPWLDLALERIGSPADCLLDLRGASLAHIIRARRRLTRPVADGRQHLVDHWSTLAGSERPLAPRLWIDAQARDAAVAVAAGASALIVLAAGGATDSKRWPAERFAAVARRLAGGPLAQAAILVLGAGARDAAVGRAIVNSLDADGIAARNLGGELDLLAAAALLERATLCIGNDNALTHIAAAAGTATLTLFGPTDERMRAPYGPRARTLRAMPLEELAATQDTHAAINALSIDAVEAAALEILHAGGLR